MVGFYAGSFDPFTNGHLHVVRTASKLFDKVIIGIGINSRKIPRYENELMKEADTDFYTRSMDLSAEDFELDDDFKEKSIKLGHNNYPVVDAEEVKADVPAFISDIVAPVNAQRGYKLPVSTFVGDDKEAGTFETGTSRFEKRGVAVNVPVWVEENCIQCNRCAYVCPHAAIRPVAMTEAEAANAPEGMQMKDLTQMPGYKFAIVVSSYDCTGCGSCVNTCPDKVQAITMQNFEANADQQKYFDYAVTLPEKEDVIEKFKKEKMPVILAINKVDTLADKTELMSRIFSETSRIRRRTMI